MRNEIRGKKKARRREEKDRLLNRRILWPVKSNWQIFKIIVI
jgi:hypothetical protein